MIVAVLVALAVVGAGAGLYVAARAARSGVVAPPGAGPPPVTPVVGAAGVGGITAPIPGVGDVRIGIRDAPIPVGTGTTLGQLRARARLLAVATDNPPADQPHWANNARIAREAAARLGWPPASTYAWAASGGALEVPILGNIAGITHMFVTRVDFSRGLGENSPVVAADYACPPGFLGIRGC